MSLQTSAKHKERLTHLHTHLRELPRHSHTVIFSWTQVKKKKKKNRKGGKKVAPVRTVVAWMQKEKKKE